MKAKKGVSALIPIGLGIGVFSIVLAVVALVLDKFQAQMTANSYSYNITALGLQALITTAGFLGVIALTLIGGYLIFVVVSQFRGSGSA